MFDTDETYGSNGNPIPIWWKLVLTKNDKSSQPFVEFWLKLSLSISVLVHIMEPRIQQQLEIGGGLSDFGIYSRIIDWWNAECANCRMLDCDSCKRATDVNTCENIAVLVKIFFFWSLWLEDVCLVNKRTTLRGSYLVVEYNVHRYRGQVVNCQCVNRWSYGASTSLWLLRPHACMVICVTSLPVDVERKIT